MAKKSVLDMIKAEHKENQSKNSETKTVVIKINLDDFNVLDGICNKYNKSKQEVIIKALENEGLFNKSELSSTNDWVYELKFIDKVFILYCNEIVFKTFPMILSLDNCSLLKSFATVNPR